MSRGYYSQTGWWMDSRVLKNGVKNALMVDVVQDMLCREIPAPLQEQQANGTPRSRCRHGCIHLQGVE